jgi:hypothetical protein
MCRLRSDVEVPSLFQVLRELFRREPPRREAAEVVPLRETTAARDAQAEETKRSEAA